MSKQRKAQFKTPCRHLGESNTKPSPHTSVDQFKKLAKRQKWRKNLALKDDEWGQISAVVQKRKRDGKETEVVIDGEVADTKKLKRSIKRHQRDGRAEVDSGTSGAELTLALDRSDALTSKHRSTRKSCCGQNTTAYPPGRDARDARALGCDEHSTRHGQRLRF